MFIVDRLIKTNNNEEIAILKGIIVRIKADSPVNDLEKIDKRVVEIKVKSFENRIQKFLNEFLGWQRFSWSSFNQSGKFFEMLFKKKARRFYFFGLCIFWWILINKNWKHEEKLHRIEVFRLADF